MPLAQRGSLDEDHAWSAEGRAAERVRREVQAGQAAVTVAGHAADAAECKELLDMLGLELDVVKQRSAA